MDRIKIDLEAWESAPSPIYTKNVNLEKAERELYLVMTYIHGYSDSDIERLLADTSNDEFHDTLCREEEISVMENGGKYYEDMSDEEYKAVC